MMNAGRWLTKRKFEIETINNRWFRKNDVKASFSEDDSFIKVDIIRDQYHDFCFTVPFFLDVDALRCVMPLSLSMYVYKPYSWKETKHSLREIQLSI